MRKPIPGMSAVVYYNEVRVQCPDGGVLSFRKLGDLNVADNPKIVKPTLGKWYTKARRTALDALSDNMWGAR